MLIESVLCVGGSSLFAQGLPQSASACCNKRKSASSSLPPLLQGYMKTSASGSPIYAHQAHKTPSRALTPGVWVGASDGCAFPCAPPARLREEKSAERLQVQLLGLVLKNVE